MTRAFRAVVERDLRKFLRNPRLVAAALLLPAVELVVVGNTIGGAIRDVPLALVDRDGGPAAIELTQRLWMAQDAARAATLRREPSLDQALAQIRAGRIAGAVVIDDGFSERVLRGQPGGVALVVDNADLLVAAHLEAVLGRIAARDQSAETWMAGLVELFPFVDYIQYLTPGAITLAIYITCLLGGGILYVDDRIRGIHEGYLAAPATALELSGGLVVSGALKAIVCTAIVTVFGLYYSGLAGRVDAATVLKLAAITLFAALALSGLIAALTARIRDVFLSRVLVAALNLLFLLPSGAVWPVAGFPDWMRPISQLDPFTYMVHAYRTVLLRDAAWNAITGDLAILAALAAFGAAAAWIVFPRRL